MLTGEIAVEYSSTIRPIATSTTFSYLPIIIFEAEEKLFTEDYSISFCITHNSAATQLIIFMTMTRC